MTAALPRLNLPRLRTGAFAYAPAARQLRSWFLAEARGKQRPPAGDWITWLILAGRGFGKTKTIMEWCQVQAHTYPGSIGHIVAPTSGDARDVLIGGPSGLLNCYDQSFRPDYRPSQRAVLWPNGSRALLFSAEEPNRLRGPQCHWAAADELAAWKYPEAMDQLLFGLRLGKRPRLAVATTPRPTRELRDLIAEPTTVTVAGTTYENRENLAPAFFEQIIRKYEGTRLGRQELNAELLADVEGALWTYGLLESCIVGSAPALRRIVVGVDPKVSAAADSETGIVAVGIDADGLGYVIEDASTDGSPETWAKAVVDLYRRHNADRVVAEVNQGGDLVESVLRAIDDRLPLTKVRAARGKYTRAEPVAALYEQGKIKHVGGLAKLVDQMCTWVPGEQSPDRLDALVWAVTDLMIGTPSVEPMARRRRPVGVG